jgi:hypothetical protein
MKITKYKITVQNKEGFGILVYQDGAFKSFLTEVKPPFTDKQLNWILSRIPALELMLTESLVLKSKGTLNVVPYGETSSTNSNEITPANRVITLFCDLYKENLGVAYKVSPADAGKIKALSTTTEIEWLKLLTTYFDSNTFVFKLKSIGNMVKYWNELRAETFGTKAPVKVIYPLPYDHLFFVTLDMKGQQEYWDHLRKNGYVFEKNEGRNSKWVKKQTLI